MFSVKEYEYWSVSSSFAERLRFTCSEYTMRGREERDRVHVFRFVSLECNVRGGTQKQFRSLVAVRPALNFRGFWTSNDGAKAEVFVQCSWIHFVLSSKYDYANHVQEDEMERSCVTRLVNVINLGKPMMTAVDQ